MSKKPQQPNPGTGQHGADKQPYCQPAQGPAPQGPPQGPAPETQQQGPPNGPPQGPYQGQPWGPAQYPPPQRRPKKWFQRVWFWILAIIVAIIVVISLSNCGGSDATGAAGAASDPQAQQADSGKQQADSGKADSNKQPADEDSEEKTAEIGDAVKSGHFKFTVTKVSGGVTQVGSTEFGQEAQGQFILVSVTVTNVGDSSETFFGSDQKLLDGDGKEYSADDEAAIYLEDSNSLLEEINPGNTAKGTIVFDVPQNVTPKFIEFSGALFSSSVKVALN